MSAVRRGAGSSSRAARGPRPADSGGGPRGPRPAGTGGPRAPRGPTGTGGPRQPAGEGRGPGRSARSGAGRDGDAEAAKPKKESSGGLRRTRQKARITKKTGDVRSKPDTREDGSPKRPYISGPVTGSGIRFLRGLGHHLDPIVQIGKDGITDALVAATVRALNDHELIKVKVGSEAPVDRKEAGPELATKTGATLAQTLGRTLLLYKRHPSKPKIDLPR